MRPVRQKIGTCTTAVPAMTGASSYDCSQLREKVVQLIDVGGHWSAGTVKIEASLDGGTTWATVPGLGGLTAAGLYVLPAAMLGSIRATAASLSANTVIAVWVGALDSRTE